MGTKSAINTLASALFGKTRQAILSLFFTNIERSFYLRQIAQIVDSGMGAVQRELSSLANAGILIRKKEGRQVYFQINTLCPIYNELLSIVSKTSGLRGMIEQSLYPLKDKIRIAFVYGSFAKSRQTLDSDIDLFIIGNVSFSNIVEALETAQKSLEREINPSIYTEEEFVKKLKRGNHFLNAILPDEKVFVIGNADELAAMVE